MTAVWLFYIGIFYTYECALTRSQMINASYMNISISRPFYLLNALKTSYWYEFRYIYTENACRHSFFLYPNMFFFSNYCQYHKIIVHVIETEEYVEHEHELCLFIHLLFLKINLLNLVREMILNLNHSRIGLSFTWFNFIVSKIRLLM